MIKLLLRFDLKHPQISCTRTWIFQKYLIYKISNIFILLTKYRFCRISLGDTVWRHYGMWPEKSWHTFTSRNAIKINIRRFIPVPNPDPPSWHCLACSYSCLRLPTWRTSVSLATASNVSSSLYLIVQYFVIYDCTFLENKLTTKTITITANAVLDIILIQCCAHTTTEQMSRHVHNIAASGRPIHPIWYQNDIAIEFQLRWVHCPRDVSPAISVGPCCRLPDCAIV